MIGAFLTGLALGFIAGAAVVVIAVMILIGMSIR